MEIRGCLSCPDFFPARMWCCRHSQAGCEENVPQPGVRGLGNPSQCAAGPEGAEKGPGQADGEKGFFLRAGLAAFGLLSVCLSSGKEALVHAAVFPTVSGKAGAIPACHIPISPHFLQAGVRQRLGRLSCVHACMSTPRGATEPVGCVFPTVREVLWVALVFWKGLFRSQASSQARRCPPAMRGTWWPAGQLCHVAGCPAVPLHGHEPHPCGRAESCCLCVLPLPMLGKRGGSPFPAPSPPQPTYFGCACPILPGSLALLPTSLCWDLAAALTSPARAEGPMGLPIKSHFFCLRAGSGVCRGQD